MYTTVIESEHSKANEMKNILNQEIKKPVYLMNKDECIGAALASDSRTREIASHFYKISGELLSSYA